MKRSIAGLTLAAVVAAGCGEGAIPNKDVSGEETGAQNPSFEQTETDTAVGRATLTTSFDQGSLIIAADTAQQDASMFKAIGLVRALTLAGVPVEWVVKPSKAYGEADFSVMSRLAATSNTPASRNFAAGPFVVKAVNRAAALPIVEQWKTSNTVNVFEATEAFSANVKETLTAAPKIGVMALGDDVSVFNVLNAAGIPQSNGTAWPTVVDLSGQYPGHPDVLTPAEISGSLTGTIDGALLNSEGKPNYGILIGNGGALGQVIPAEVRKEIRAWLRSAKGTKGIFTGSMATGMEDTLDGRFITTNGLVAGLGLVSQLVVNVPEALTSQFEGSLSGLLATILGYTPLKLNGGALKPGAVIEQSLSGQALNDSIMSVTGVIDGDATKGEVSLLGSSLLGINLPLSLNRSSNASRILLDATLAAPGGLLTTQPDVVVNIDQNTIQACGGVQLDLTALNQGASTATDTILAVTVPVGVEVLNVQNGGTLDPLTNIITWPLGNLNTGATGVVSATVAPTAVNVNLGTTVSLLSGLTRAVKNRDVSMVGDTQTPETDIDAKPPEYSNNTAPNFDFTSNDPDVTYECSVDGGAYAPCSKNQGFTMQDGEHTVSVRARDCSGNVDPTPAVYQFVVDTIAPVPTIVNKPAAVTTSTTANFTFTSNETNTTFTCKLDNAAAAACGATYNVSNLAVGNHTLVVTATDRAGNSSNRTYTWRVNSSGEVLNPTPTPEQPSEETPNEEAPAAPTPEEAGWGIEGGGCSAGGSDLSGFVTLGSALALMVSRRRKM